MKLSLLIKYDDKISDDNGYFTKTSFVSKKFDLYIDKTLF